MKSSTLMFLPGTIYGFSVFFVQHQRSHASMCVGAALVLHLQYWFINETTYLLLHWKHSVTMILVQCLIWLEIRYLTCAFRCFNRQQPRLYIKFIWNTRLSENPRMCCTFISVLFWDTSCSFYSQLQCIHSETLHPPTGPVFGYCPADLWDKWRRVSGLHSPL